MTRTRTASPSLAARSAAGISEPRRSSIIGFLILSRWTRIRDALAYSTVSVGSVAQNIEMHSLGEGTYGSGGYWRQGLEVFLRAPNQVVHTGSI